MIASGPAVAFHQPFMNLSAAALSRSFVAKDSSVEEQTYFTRVHVNGK